MFILLYLGVESESKIKIQVFIINLIMIPLFDITKINECNCHERLPFQCERCGEIFTVTKNQVMKALNNHPRIKIKYCSVNCRYKGTDKTVDINCTECGKSFKKQRHRIAKNNFCSQSCSVTYNNKHKIIGNRRSKLERYLAIELIKRYMDLELSFNKKNVINSELDIYIPRLKLAFELNGIFHYEPIYGQEKLNQIQNNDNRKFQACIEKGIELCIIDTSQQKYFKEQSSKKFLSIITKIIDKKLGVRADSNCHLLDSQSSTLAN